MMSTRVARPAPSDGASTVLDRLAPADLAIAELKALVGEGLTKTAFFEVVRACGIASPDHKAWTTQKINESVARLAARGVLSTDGVAEDSWRAALTSRVALAPTGPALARRVRDAAPKSWREGGAYQYYHGLSRPPYFDADLARAARLMALAGDEAQVERLIAVAEREATQDGHPMSMAPALLRGLPADPAFLVKPAPGLRDRIRSAWIEMLLDDGRLEPGLAAQIAAASGENVDWTSAPRFDLAMMRLDLMGERPDAARIRIARLRDSAPVMALAGQATLAFLGGTPGGGVALFREALKQHRKALGKRFSPPTTSPRTVRSAICWRRSKGPGRMSPSRSPAFSISFRGASGRPRIARSGSPRPTSPVAKGPTRLASRSPPWRSPWSRAPTPRAATWPISGR